MGSLGVSSIPKSGPRSGRDGRVSEVTKASRLFGFADNTPRAARSGARIGIPAAGRIAGCRRGEAFTWRESSDACSD